LSVTPAAVDPNPEPFFNSQGDINPNYSFAEPTVSTIPPSVITGTADGLLGPGNYSWSLDLHRVAGVENDGSIASGSPYGDGSGVILLSADPRQETITDPEGGHIYASYAYNPSGLMTVLPVGGFAWEYPEQFDFDY